MRECDRCGESYPSGSRYSTLDYCGTCVFINGDPPVDKVTPPPTYINKVPLKYRPEVSEEDSA